MQRLLSLILLVLPLVAQAGPRDTVAGLQLALLEFAQSEVAGFEDRYTALRPVVESTHDLDYIARLTLGRYWRDLAAEQRTRFIDRFRQLAISSYAARFPQFAGEKFEFVSEAQQPRGVFMVRTRLHRPSGESIDFDYLLRETADGWRIVNIMVDGVSDLALKRAEYAGVLRNGSADDLLQLLDEQLTRLRSG
ncbi:MAG: ABC transporter substrate-binding protein [Gammaproteobacteria bacterium]|nr:ABC transporter substrate-binding protein [Gammaproteobacteria bacterium]NNF62197.1 transporter [Gammaproteobacteria bacterium]NNM20118.1 transporter [Gammaproteobacteria bacterium]